MFAGHPDVLAQNILERQLDEAEEILESIFASQLTIKGRVTAGHFLFQLSDSAKTILIEEAELAQLQCKNVSRKNLEVQLGFKDSSENINKLAEVLGLLKHYHESQSFVFEVSYPPKVYDIVRGH